MNIKKLCPKCGHAITPLDKTCPNCGAKFRWGVSHASKSPEPKNLQISSKAVSSQRGQNHKAEDSSSTQLASPKKVALSKPMASGAVQSAPAANQDKAKTQPMSPPVVSSTPSSLSTKISSGETPSNPKSPPSETPSMDASTPDASKAETKPMPELPRTAVAEKDPSPERKRTSRSKVEETFESLQQAPRRPKGDWTGITIPTEFVFGGWPAKWIVRVLSIVFAVLCFGIYANNFTLQIGHFWPWAVGCMFFALSFDNRFAVVASWLSAIVGLVAFCCLGVHPEWWWGHHVARPLWQLIAFANGICLLVFLASYIAKNKWWQNCAMWSFCGCNVLMGIFAVKTSLTYWSEQSYIILVLFVVSGCMIYFTHRRTWWQERLLQLDGMREPQRPSKSTERVDVPEYMFLKFFIPCCWVAVALVLLVALVGFTVQVEIGTGWSSHKVRLFSMLSFLSGDSENAWWKYWLVVLVECLHIGAAALYASSVLSTLQTNAVIAESLQLNGKECNETLDGFGNFIKFIAFITALICIFACAAFFNEWGWDALGLALICIIAGGALTIATYGWGSIFCAQAWNEKMAIQTMQASQDEDTLEQLKHDLPGQKVSKQERRQREWIRRETEHIDIRMRNALAYRDLSVLVGSKSMCPDVLSAGDSARDKAMMECKNASFENADVCCTEAKAAYREACVLGAAKLARLHADLAKTAFLKGKWSAARSAAQESMAFDPMNADAIRIYRKARKKNFEIA